MPHFNYTISKNYFTSSNIIRKEYQQLIILWYKYGLSKPLYTNEQE